MSKREALTQQDMDDMKQMDAAGMSLRAIGRIKKCHETTVGKAKAVGFKLQAYKELRIANNGSKKQKEPKKEAVESDQDDVLMKKVIELLERLIDLLK